MRALPRRTSGRASALCLRMCGDATRATELVHDVFVRVWEKLSRLRGDSAFGTWVHLVVVNVVLERQRSDRRREAHEEGGVDARDAPSWPMPARRIDPGDRIDLEAAIARLPTKNAFLVVHAFHHGTPTAFPMTGTADGAVNGERRWLTLRFSKTSRTGVFALGWQGPNEVTWTLIVRCRIARTTASRPSWTSRRPTTWLRCA